MVDASSAHATDVELLVWKASPCVRYSWHTLCALLSGSSCNELRLSRRSHVLPFCCNLHAFRCQVVSAQATSCCICVQGPKAEAASILQRRFPVPRLVDCDQNGSQVHPHPVIVLSQPYFMSRSASPC